MTKLPVTVVHCEPNPSPPPSTTQSVAYRTVCSIPRSSNFLKKLRTVDAKKFIALLLLTVSLTMIKGESIQLLGKKIVWKTG